MQPTTPINALDSLSTDNTNQPQKTNQPEPSTDHTPNFIDILEQTKYQIFPNIQNIFLGI
jgi:hypothetical protein